MTLSLRSFALINAAVWCGYGLLNGLLFVVFAGGSSGMAAIAVLLAIAGWAATLVIRHLAHVHGWLARGPVAMGLRLLAAVLVAAALVQVVVSGGVALLHGAALVRFPGDNQSDFRLVALLGYWLNTVFLLLVWSVAWLGMRAVRRARQDELTRLRMQAEHRALELDALRARLNPHFVFNALNNLRALINEDTERARELVTRLSNTLRHALEHHAHGEVTLAQELAVMDDYLAVESVHYEQRLRVVRDIEPAALALRLPPMLLQLLVENAIKHGISRVAGGGELRIVACVVDGGLHVDVENPCASDTTPGPSNATHVDGDGRRGGVGLAYLRAQLAGDPRHRFVLDEQAGVVRAHLEIAQ